MERYLVEIRLKDWEPPLKSGSRIVCFEEVLAYDEVGARHVAFDQFSRRCGYEPAMQLLMKKNGLTPHNCCAPDAVVIEKVVRND